MNPDTVQEQLLNYIVEQRLDGDASGIDASTPLLAWGVLDSLSVVDLMTFIEQSFAVRVPAEQVTAKNLETLRSITELVMRASKQSSDSS